MKAGDHHRTNRMFRRRIYAQGFTLISMVAGSVYWSGDRSKRKEFDELVEEKKKKDKHEAWIKELEVRDQEDQEFDALRKRAQEARKANGSGIVRSALEKSESKSQSGILAAAARLWESRR